jgi:hypothetical protein
VLLLCAGLGATGVLAQDGLAQGQPYVGPEPLPAALAAEAGEGVLAVWDLRIVGSALKPRQSGVTWATNGSGGCVYATASPSTVWNTPLYLPQGAQVTTLRSFYDDTSASNFQTWFTIYDLYGAIVDEFSAPSVGATGQDFNDSLPINHVINYSLYSYAINYRPVATGSTLQFCGVRIFYEY